MLLTCIEIFFARFLDVTISTCRMMIMVRKKSFITPILAFCEVFVWFYAARKALTTPINSILIPICYSLGYATGTIIGGCIAHRFVKNINSVEITTKKNNYKLIDTLREKGYGLSIIGLKENLNEDKDLLIIDIKEKETKELLKLVKEIDEEAFIVVKDTKVVHNGFIK